MSRSNRAGMPASPVSPQRRRVLLGSAAAAGAWTLGLPAWSQSAAPDLRRVTLRIGDQTGQSQSLLRAAGLLDDVPYKIEWSQYPAAVNLHEALKAEATDIGSANDSPTVSAIAGGSKVLAVAGWSNGGRGTSLLVPRNSPLRSIADLRGRTVSPTTRGSVAHHLVVGVLKEAGLATGDVKLAFLSPTDATAAFGSGSIDAWAIWGVFRARAIGSLGARELHDGSGINSGLSVLSAIPSAVSDPGKWAAIRDYVSRVDRGYEWARANRAAFVDWYSAFAKQDRETAESVYDENATYRPVPLDDAFVARLQKTHRVWLDEGVVREPIDFSTRVVRRDRA